jgi:hypothetical protein
MLKKVILLFVLICAATVFAAAAQDSGLTFLGNIEEISTKTTMTPMGGMEKYLVLKLDSKPRIDFRVTGSDAARFGIIDSSQPSAVLTPDKIKGVGWKVRLTCNKSETLGGPPIYLVTKLERLD